MDDERQQNGKVAIPKGNTISYAVNHGFLHGMHRDDNLLQMCILWMKWKMQLHTTETETKRKSRVIALFLWPFEGLLTEKVTMKNTAAAAKPEESDARCRAGGQARNG